MSRSLRITAAAWTIFAVLLVAYTYSGAKDAIIVGSLYLAIWTFPVGLVCFFWRAYGLPWIPTTTSFLFENVLLVALTFAIWFYLLPKLRSRMYASSTRP